MTESDMTIDDAIARTRRLRMEMLAGIEDAPLAPRASVSYQEGLALLDLARLAFERAAMQQAQALAGR